MPQLARQSRRAWIALATALAGAWLAPVARAAPVRTAAREWMMGTVADVRIYDAPDAVAARAALEAALAEMRAVDRLMAVQRADSDVSRVNREGASGAVVVDARVIDVLRTSVAVSRLTDGAFDVTVLPAVQAWGFTGPRPARPPSPAGPAAGVAALDIDPEARTVRLRTPRTGIDLGGIAKGYALDRARETLRRRGVRSAWIDLGGNVITLGAPPEGGRWRVGIRHPRRPGAVLGVLAIDEASVSTSGDAERFVEDDQGRFGHVFDPRTGRPAEQRVATATVVASSGTMADALSTAAVVMGPAAFLALADRLDVQAALGMLDGVAPLALVTTPGLVIESADQGEGREP